LPGHQDRLVHVGLDERYLITRLACLAAAHFNELLRLAETSDIERPRTNAPCALSVGLGH
jgi:hypothetical protein